jgi:Holliday junction resolvasome RuvABC DNA-binding subunit
MEILTPTDSRWDAFCDRFEESMDNGDADCNKNRAARALESMGYDEAQVAATLDYFEMHGGGCDVEILLNLVLA